MAAAELPNIEMNFNEIEIPFSEIFVDYTDRALSENMKLIWDLRKKGDQSFEIINERENGKKFLHFGHKFIYMSGTINTILANDQCCLFDYPRYRNFNELCSSGSYPIDYNFLNLKPEYLIGMSVPPIMTAQIASQIYEQWLSKIN